MEEQGSSAASKKCLKYQPQNGTKKSKMTAGLRGTLNSALPVDSVPQYVVTLVMSLVESVECCVGEGCTISHMEPFVCNVERSLFVLVSLFHLF